MDTVGINNDLNSTHFVLRRPKSAKKISPHHFTPPPDWTADRRQGESRVSCCLHTNPDCHPADIDLETQTRKYCSNFREAMWTVASVFRSCMTRVGSSVVFCYCSPSASRFNVLYDQRCSSAYLASNKWLFKLLLFKAVGPSAQRTDTHWILSSLSNYPL